MITSEDFELSLVHTARARFKQFVRVTPLLNSGFGKDITYKAESLQVTGSFKVRPALNQLAHLSGEEKRRGVVTSSSGNFAQAVAYSAAILGVSAKIVMMESSNPLKVERTRRQGGEVVFCPDRFEERARLVEKIASEEGRVQVFPYDHILAVAGNGTLAVEILEQLEAARNIVVPISGGGLISGIAVTAAHLNPKVKVWGVQAAGSNATYLSFRKGQPQSIERAITIADGLTVTSPGRLTFPLIQGYVEDVVVVQEDTILEAVKHFLHEERLVVEPSGAVPLAAVLEEKIPADKTVLLLSGGNIAPRLLANLTKR